MAAIHQQMEQNTVAAMNIYGVKRFSKQLAKALIKKGNSVDVIICPEKEFTVSTQEKIYKLNIVNKHNYDLVIELHLKTHQRQMLKALKFYINLTPGKNMQKRFKSNFQPFLKTEASNKEMICIFLMVRKLHLY